MDRLFFKYLAPLLVISIVPILASGILLFVLTKQNISLLEDNIIQQNTESLTNEVSFKNEALARGEGLYIEQEVDRIGNKMNAMVLSPDFIDFDIEKLNSHIENVLSIEPAIIEMSVVNKWGEVIYSKVSALSLATDEPTLVSDPKLFKTLQDKQSYVSDVEVSNKTQLPYISLSQPVLDLAGNFNGGVIVKLDLSFIWDIVASKAVGEQGILYIISDKGALISHPVKREIYQNADYAKYDYIQTIMDMENGTIKKEKSLVSFYKNKYNWTTIIEIPMEQALATVNENRETIYSFIGATFRSISYTTVVIILFILLIAAFGAVFITRKIIAPIVNLTSATRKISEGELNLQIERKSNDEIGELTDSFNKMTEELKKKRDELVRSNEYIKDQAEELLERYNSDLEQFAYVTTHDLIEPLRMITSYVQLLQRRYKDLYDDDAREFMQYIIEGVERMHRIINDLFEYSHIRTNVKDFETVDFNEAFEVVLAKLDKEINESGTIITCDRLPTTKAVSSNIIQVFQNLIGNAIKFKKEDEVLTINVTATEKDNEWLFMVKDSGMGMDPKYKDKIFEIFKRLNKRDEYSGSGMGLAIVKNIVERHGGKIWVESAIGEGATFYFTIKKY